MFPYFVNTVAFVAIGLILHVKGISYRKAAFWIIMSQVLLIQINTALLVLSNNQNPEKPAVEQIKK